MKKTCLTCSNFSNCKHLGKSANFVCNAYKKQEARQSNYVKNLFGSSDFVQSSSTGLMLPKSSDGHKYDELKLVAMLDEVLNPDINVPRDLKVDDRDLPEFPNFFEFSTSKTGLNIVPFARQLFLAASLFCEICPRCSNPKYIHDIEAIPVDYPTMDIQEHIQFLHLGVCPKCKATRRELVKNKEVNFYNELAACIGQRGGKSILVSILSAYVTHRYLKLQKPTEVLGLLNNTTLTGTFVALTYQGASELLWAPYRDLLAESPWFCVAFDTNITMASGETKQIRQIEVGDYVETFTGKQKVLNVFDNGVKECFSVSIDNGTYIEGTKEHLIRVLSSDGDSLIWKQIGCLTENDYVVVEQEITHGLKIDERKKLSRVLSVSSVGKKQVFDLEVANTHNYFANGINVHNCEYHKLLDHYSEKYDETIYKNEDTFLHYKHRGILFYPSGPNKRTLRGRCLTGSTLINTSSGFIQLDELVTHRGQHPICNTYVDTPNGTRKVSHTFKDKSPTILIQTRNGFSVEGTPEHPMLVITRNLKYVWKPLDQLVVGDFIVSKTKYNTPMYGNNDINLDIATLLGYHVANGYGNEISSDNVKVVKRLFATFKRVTGCYPTSYGKSKERAETHYLKTGKNGEGKSFIRDYFEPLGYTSTNSSNKHIPFSIRTAPKEILHSFLEAYFECDSGINGGSSKNGAPSEIEVGSASEQLATQLHTILFHNYNILGRLVKKVWYDRLNKKTGVFNAKRVYWSITITGGDAYRFIQTFKRAKVQKYAHRIKKVADGYCSDRRNIPYIREFLWNTFENARLSDESGKRLRRLVLSDGSLLLNKVKPRCFDRVRNSSTSFSNSPEFLIYEDEWDELLPIIKKIDESKYTLLRKFLKLRAHYEEVVSIKHCNKEKIVYDITVPDGHAFTANCLSSHNTRLLSAIDEIGWFSQNDDSVKISADEIYTALDRSLLTVRSAARNLLKSGFNNIPTGYAFNISSPSHALDKIMSLVKTHRNSRSVFTVHLPTWKFNPNIKKSDLKKEYLADPVKAERDYGANPPLVDSPFIENQEMVDSIFTTHKNRITCQNIHKKNKQGKLMRAAKIVNLSKPSHIPPSILAIDAGYSNNSFALVVGHRSSIDNKRIVFDTIIEVMPVKGKITLNHNRIFTNIIHPLIDALNVQVLLADRWNSLFLLHKVEEDYGISAQQYSMKYDDFFLVKSYMEGGRISVPKTELPKESILNMDMGNYPHLFDGKPLSHFYLQCLTVQDTGRTIDKGKELTDDLFRAFSLAAVHLIDEEFCSKYLKTAKVNRNAGIGALGLRSGGDVGGSLGTISSSTGQGIIASSGSISGGTSTSVFVRNR